MEVDLETELPEAINLTVVEWSHTQELYYEQIPFKYKLCHCYGHFSRNCKKKGEEENANEKNEQWTLVQKAGISNLKPRKKIKEGKIVANDSVVEKLPTPLVNTPIGPSNHFVVLISSDLEEGEVQHLDGIKMDSIVTTPNHAGPPHSIPLRDGEPPLPIGDCSPPSYADIAQKKSVESSNSFDENSIEQLSKKGGRKSKEELQEEELERLKTQGSWSTIEMSYGRSKRNRPPKGAVAPSNPSK